MGDRRDELIAEQLAKLIRRPEVRVGQWVRNACRWLCDPLLFVALAWTVLVVVVTLALASCTPVSDLPAVRCPPEHCIIERTEP